MSRRRIPDEFELIAEYFAPLAADMPGAFGLSDDAATIAVAAGRQLVATVDAMIAGVHFRADDPADQVARKLLRVNLSDLAAMGARPSGYLLALMLPRDFEPAWVRGFADGLARDQATFGIGLLGGDTVAGPGPAAMSLTALGEVEAGAALRRDGARDGDTVFVSGTLGDAALGLAVLDGGLNDLSPAHRDHLASRYRLPQPRLALGAALAGVANAAVDISDGLVADLGHVAAASGIGADVDAARVPMSAAAAAALARDPSRRETVLTGGDDYELLFTAADTRAGEVDAIARSLGLGITAIGRMGGAAGVRVRGEDGGLIRLKTAGFRHF